MQELTLPKLRIEGLDENAMAAARQRQSQLTKSAGSLGRLEQLSVRLAGMTGQAIPEIDRKAVVVMAADHGVTQEGVSAYPSEVTAQMVANFLAGGAAINALARQVGARVAVIDMGVAVDLEPHPDLTVRKIAAGTANMAKGPAMSREQAIKAIEIGREVMRGLAEENVQLVGTGEMGIGNTTSSSAITAAITGANVHEVVGRGTGIDDDGLARKRSAVRRALETNRPDSGDPIDVLAKVGGFEIGGLTGLILEAASLRVPVVLDGFITGAAALLAAELEPGSRDYMIAAHQSVERGHAIILSHLGLEPLMRLELRLGEGSGAALAMHTLEAAVRTLDEMATFESAGVSDQE